MQCLYHLLALGDFTVALCDSLDQINRSRDTDYWPVGVVSDLAPLISTSKNPFFGICISAIMMGRIGYCETTRR